MTYYGEKQLYTETCKIISNFDRTRFNIVKDEISTSKRRLLGTITYSLSINNSKSLVLYYPKLNERNEATIFYQNDPELDLQHIYRENKIQEVNFIMTTKIDMVKRLDLMSFY